jgi:hypothetical protein
MARTFKHKKKKKSGIPLEVEEKILAMSPMELTVDSTFERNAIDALKKSRKEDPQIIRLEEQKKEMDKELETTPEVVKAKEAYEQAKADNTTEEMVDVKESIAALRKGYAADIKDRSKTLKFMEKTLKHHIESGALKRKN